MKMMRNPLDLDPFETEQVEITRVLDAMGGQGAVLGLIKTAMSGTITVGFALNAVLPAPLWQRAAYEARVMADKSGLKSDDRIAYILWSYAKFCQEMRECGEAIMADQELITEMSQRADPFPDISKND